MPVCVLTVCVPPRPASFFCQVETEQLKAVNRVLTQDVERLEDERLALKQKLIAQAMQRGQRAVELGLTTGDLAAAETAAAAAEAAHPQPPRHVPAGCGIT